MHLVIFNDFVSLFNINKVLNYDGSFQNNAFQNHLLSLTIYYQSTYYLRVFNFKITVSAFINQGSSSLGTKIMSNNNISTYIEMITVFIKSIIL